MEKLASSYPIKVFYSYARKDRRLCQQLEAHLSLLRKQSYIVDWYDREISAGTDWAREIDKHLNDAHIILLLISADFLASDYCYSKEMERALARHQAQEARVIPILLRDVDYHHAPFSHLKMLPGNGKAVTSRSWRTRDEAFADIATGIRRVVEEIRPSYLAGSDSPLPETEEKPSNASGPQQKGLGLKMQHISELKAALQRRTLVLFVGNDLPDSITGLPPRANLARELAQSHGLDERLSLAEVAQRISQNGNRFTFTRFLLESLDTTHMSPQPFHRSIEKLVRLYRLEILISTAYDTLLEAAFQEAGTSYNQVITGNDVSFIRSERPTIIKLYGDTQRPETLVVTDRDHFDMLRDTGREPLLNEVRHAFRRNSILFLGYNLTDPDIRFLFDQVAQGAFAHRCYAVWSGMGEADVQMWRDRGITILDAHPLDVLAALTQP